MTVDREKIRRRPFLALTVRIEGVPESGILITVEERDALLAELEQAEKERDEAREDVARCAADTTAPDLAQDVAFLEAERGSLLAAARQRQQREAALESRLAKVPALVEALEMIDALSTSDAVPYAFEIADAALTAWNDG